jgi:integrase
LPRIVRGPTIEYTAVRPAVYWVSVLKSISLSYLAHSYVFVTETGEPDVSNFRARVWEPALKKAGLKYRYPYQARHTFATKHLGRGYNPLWVANQMETSPEMIYKHYAVYLQKAWSPSGQNALNRTRKESDKSNST